LVGVEPEIIQRAPANRIGILIGRKSVRAPGDGACFLVNSPGCAAKSGVPQRAVMCPAGMLRRGMEIDVTNVDSWSQRHAEGLDGAIEVHVKESILIVPDSRSGASDFVTREPDTVVWIGPDRAYYCARSGP
jgi:hypothetical protein